MLLMQCRKAHSSSSGAGSGHTLAYLSRDLHSASVAMADQKSEQELWEGGAVQLNHYLVAR